jgi:hypothetical protein
VLARGKARGRPAAIKVRPKCRICAPRQRCRYAAAWLVTAWSCTRTPARLFLAGSSPSSLFCCGCCWLDAIGVAMDVFGKSRDVSGVPKGYSRAVTGPSTLRNTASLEVPTSERLRRVPACAAGACVDGGCFSLTSHIAIFGQVFAPQRECTDAATEAVTAIGGVVGETAAKGQTTKNQKNQACHK